MRVSSQCQQFTYHRQAGAMPSGLMQRCVSLPLADFIDQFRTISENVQQRIPLAMKRHFRDFTHLTTPTQRR
ncbi:hypothetical protein D9M68_910410 [compost metagenome]